VADSALSLQEIAAALAHRSFERLAMIGKTTIATRLLFDDRTGAEIIEAVRKITGKNYVIAKDPRFPDLVLVGQASDAGADHLRVTADGERGFRREQRYSGLRIEWAHWPKIVFRNAKNDSTNALATLQELARKLDALLT
jgi:hypothetical protein